MSRKLGELEYGNEGRLMRRWRPFVRPAVVAAGISVVFALALLAWGSVRAASWPTPQVISQSQDEIVFSVRVPGYSLEPVLADGKTYTNIIAQGLVPFAGEGEPNLPVIAVLLALPPGGNARLVSFEKSDETTLEGVRIVPVERVEARGEGVEKFANYVYAEKESVYAGRSVFPGEVVWLGQKGRMRHQDVVRVFIAPFRYEPGRERVLVAREFRVRVAFEGGGLLRGALPREDAWQNVYRDAILNYDQGRGWRVESSPVLRAPQTANQRVKIPIGETDKYILRKTGMYRLSFDTLASLGFPADIPFDQIFLYRDVFRDGTPDTLYSNEIAMETLDNDGDAIFSSGDAIRFYARDFYDEFGRQSNEDYFFDKNIYWLSWGAGQHARMTTRAGWRDAASTNKPTKFADFIHIERDSFFVNFPMNEIMDLYVWTRLRRIDKFELPGVDPASNSTLAVNFVNYYTSPGGQPRTSQINFYMTGCSRTETPVGMITASLPSVQKASIALPAGLLCEHDNGFRFESSLLGAGQGPGNVLDWLEILYDRSYKAHDDVLIFSNGGMTGEVEYEVTGFSTSDIKVFDITDPTKLERLEVPPERIVPDDGGFKVTFRDSIAVEKKYIALVDARVMEVASQGLALKAPPRLRDVSADYLVVSHPDFAAELTRLLDFRRGQGYTVELATTDEVYDDFGNGMKSDRAIQRFVKQGFFGGGAQFVLLVGDANTDRKGVLINPPPGEPLQPASGIDYVPSHNIVRGDGAEPNKEIRPSENWFVSVDGPSDLYPDLYLGRFPVGSADETRGVVDKVLRFETYQGSEPWRKKLLLVADDEYKFGADWSKLCYYGERDFMLACDSVAAIARDFAVVAPETAKYYLRRCVAADQPTLRCDNIGCCTSWTATRTFTRQYCTPELTNLFKAGALMVNYQGHANRYQFTHEQLILEDGTTNDISALTNSDKPFVIVGLGCWISHFDPRPEPLLHDAIGERLLLNPNGAACACLASGCSEFISTNRLFNPFVARAMFSHLQGLDPQGNPVPARILVGEVVTTALVRFAKPDYAARNILFGDPATVVDMGPPLVSAAVNGSPVGEGYLFEGETYDTLDVVSEIKDEEAITSIAIAYVHTGAPSPVPADSISSEPLVDVGFTRSRAYRSTYRHLPYLGDYSLRVTGTDYSGQAASLDVRVNTGSAVFSTGEAALPKNGQVIVGQTLKALLTRPFAFTEADIVTEVDGIPADSIPGSRYAVKKVDLEGGREWEVSLVPSLAAGHHAVTVSVQGFKAKREFQYVPVRVDVFADGRNLFDDDFVSSGATLEIVLHTERGLSAVDFGVKVDTTHYSVIFEPDTSQTEWRGALELSSEITAGGHQLVVTVRGVATTRNFRISEERRLLDVSVFPNPFSADTYFFYTLTEPASEARLSIFTVSGRKILDLDVGAFAGYNQFRWDGRDAPGDRVANGTYIYKLTVKIDGSRREFVGKLVKIE